MAAKILKSIRILLILALLLAAAVTPTLADAKTKKPVKRMKISFDSNEAAASSSDEPLRPRASDRSYKTRGETVRLRAQNIDDIWAANGGDSKLIQLGSKPVVKKPKLMAKAVPAKLPKVLPAKKPAVIVERPPLREDEIDFVDMTREARAARRNQPVRVVKAPRSLRPEPEASGDETPSTHVAERTVVREQSSWDLGFVGEYNLNYSFGTTQQVEIAGQKSSVLINEVVLGFKDKSGWGAMASGSFNAVSNADSTYDVRELGDPSVIALHPDWYRDDNIRVSGYFRYFAPMSQASKDLSLHHSAYVLDADVKLVGGLDLKNSLIGRYFWQSLYYEGDAYMMIQDLTELTKHLTPELSLGLGQQTRVESHHMAETGTRVELVPLARYQVLSKMVIEAKAFLPILKSGVVGLAPLAAAIPNPTVSFSARIDF